MPVPKITAAVRNRSPAPTPHPRPLAVYQPIFNRLGTIGIGEVAARQVPTNSFTDRVDGLGSAQNKQSCQIIRPRGVLRIAAFQIVCVGIFVHVFAISTQARTMSAKQFSLQHSFNPKRVL